MLFGPRPQPAGAVKLAYSVMVTAFSGVGPIEDIAPTTGAASALVTTASPSAAKSIVLTVRDMVPSSRAASGYPRIKVFRNGGLVVHMEYGGWEFPLRAVRARLLNPWTPARPDLKSGAVVLAWLPPQRRIGRALITPFCRRFARGSTRET